MYGSQTIESGENIQSPTASTSTPPLNPTLSPDSEVHPDQNYIAKITNFLSAKEHDVKKQKTVYVCPHSSFTTFMSQHIKSHLKSHERHQGKMYQCDVCKMQFSQKANMTRHCKLCNWKFTNSKRLLLHFQSRHDNFESPPKEVNSPKIKNLSRGNASSMDPPNIGPDTSDKSTSSEIGNDPSLSMENSNLLLMCLNQMNQFGGVGENIPLHLAETEKHEQVHLWSEQTSSSSGVNSQSPYEQSPSPPAIASTLSLAMDPKKDEEEKVECTHCGITFYDNTMYLLHNSLHSEGDPFKCALCGIQCGEKYLFTTHLIFADHSTQATTSA